MKKLLVIVLGLFVFTACDDAGSGDNGGNGTGVITEQLETSLVKISGILTNGIPSNDLGTVYTNSRHFVEFTVTNLSLVDTMQLTLTNTRNSVTGFSDGTCIYDYNTITFSQPANTSCVFKADLNMVVTNEGSPFVLYFEDTNNDKLAVVIKYTLEESPITEKLTTSLVQIDVPVKDLGVVAIGSKHIFKFTIINKSAEEMSIFRSGWRDAILVTNNNMLDNTFLPCDYNPDTNIIINKTGNGSCEAIFELTILAIKQDGSPAEQVEGSPFGLYFEDANKDKLAVVLHYTIQ